MKLGLRSIVSCRVKAKRLPSVFRAAPVDPFEQHGQLGLTQQYRAAGRLWPNETAALQAFGQQVQAIASPPQQFDNVATATTKCEYVPRRTGLRTDSASTLIARPLKPERMSVAPAASYTQVDHRRGLRKTVSSVAASGLPSIPSWHAPIRAACCCRDWNVSNEGSAATATRGNAGCPSSGRRVTGGAI